MGSVRSKLQGLLPFVVVFLLWKEATDQCLWSSYILPSPQRVWETTIHMVHNGELARHIAISLRRILWGFGWAFVASCILSSLNLLFPRLRHCYSGLLEVFRHVPPLSLIPLLILWFGIGELPKTIIIVLASFFPMYLNMVDGFRRCDRKLLEVGRMLGFTPWQTLWKIRLPAALPGILTGLRVGMGYSLRAIIGAEMGSWPSEPWGWGWTGCSPWWREGCCGMSNPDDSFVWGERTHHHCANAQRSPALEKGG